MVVKYTDKMNESYMQSVVIILEMVSMLKN